MAAPRPTWKGYLKLALVSCPVAVYTATSTTERVRFNQLNRKTGNRLKQQLVDAGTRETVETADKVRGYEIDKDVYVQIEDDEIDAIAIESSQTIDIDVFVPKVEIDVRYLDAPYYVAPNDRVGEEAFVTIREAMAQAGVVALGRMVLAKRERVVVLEPWERGLLATTLRYRYEVRDAEAYFAEISAKAVEPALLTMAQQLIGARVAQFDPTLFHDRFEEALIAMLERKKVGLPAEARRPAQTAAGVIDFAEALRRSLEKQGKTPAVATANPSEKSKKPKKAAAGQREMLLPIAGKGGGKVPAADVKAPATKAAEKKPTSGRRKAS